jgi:D-amino-acid dehydrogenase
MMTRNPQVIVVGGGIIGICSALTLMERGVQVTLIERDIPAQGASMGNAGVISPYSIIPQSVPGLWKNIPRWLLNPHGPVSVRLGYLPSFLPWAIKFLRQGTAAKVQAAADAMYMLNHDNIQLYQRHLAGTGFENLIQDSCYVYAFRDEVRANLNSLDNDIRRAFGANVHQLTANELNRLEPALSLDFKSAIVVEGQARARSPGKICAVLTEKFNALGGVVVQQRATALIPQSDGWCVKTKSDIFHAPQIILAAGAWSLQLLEPLGIQAPLEAERGYHVVFKNPGVELNNSVMDMDMKFVASSMDMGLRGAGTAEYSGLNHPHNSKRLAALEQAALRLCPDMLGTEVETWSGVRPSFPDSLPVIGHIPGYTGLIGAFGHSHWGFMMGPKTGQIVADLALGRSPNLDLAPYSINRF